MNLTNAIVTALRAILRNKTRSLLTMLGVIIGVMSVILLLAIGSGLQNYITQEFESLGSNMVIINPGGDVDAGAGFSNAGGQFAAMATSKLRFEDVKELKKLRQFVTAVIPEFMSAADVAYRDQTKKNSGVYGSTEDFIKIGQVKMDKGNFFSEVEVERKQRVAVLGPGIATDLFGEVDPIGKRIRIGGSAFTVEGVFAKGGGMVGAQMDKYTVIPITTAHDLFDSEQIMSINVMVNNKDDIESAQHQIEKTLLKRLDDEDFSIMDQESILSSINSILSILSAGLSGIGAISLLVGGIGIMNIMLVSVTERTREIGLRKALGATPRVIMIQFLIESSVLSVTGGMLGVLISFIITLAVQQFFPAYITLWSVMLAFIVSAITGMVFGVLPARKAARLSPIEALRYE